MLGGWRTNLRPFWSVPAREPQLRAEVRAAAETLLWFSTRRWCLIDSSPLLPLLLNLVLLNELRRESATWFGLCSPPRRRPCNIFFLVNTIVSQRRSPPTQRPASAAQAGTQQLLAPLHEPPAQGLLISQLIYCPCTKRTQRVTALTFLLVSLSSSCSTLPITPTSPPKELRAVECSSLKTPKRGCHSRKSRRGLACGKSYLLVSEQFVQGRRFFNQLSWSLSLLPVLLKCPRWSCNSMAPFRQALLCLPTTQLSHPSQHWSLLK